MQFKKLGKGQVKAYRRNSIVCKLLTDNPRMSRSEALRIADEKVYGKKKR